ncbi:endothelin-converting enzyme [Microdochium trichocladiopsis]|uniref:Endothelin-converting enzyme n=1 Tax=Microdochium trichocladiopsis TaxID=1682393 RepID=A0A9P9BLU4_9PEZI|nr:endothelin-converting enzyme [Microdochium trichocladiopsis]KAH7025254.1 endothelin-converting enzyme [Microdochium trichocladiopsis]
MSGNNERTPLLPNEAPEAGNQSNVDDTPLDEQVRQARLRRWVSICVSVFIIVAFIAILVLAGVLDRGKKGRNADTAVPLCTTAACIHAASELLYNLSPDYKNIDACTNFDSLVCDGFNARHDIPQDRSSFSTASQMSDTGQTILRHILESPYPGQSKHSAFSPMNLAHTTANTDEENFRKMQTSFGACINETAIENVGTEPLMELIKSVALHLELADDVAEGGLGQPMTEGELGSLHQTIEFLEKIGVGSFEQLFIGADDKDPELLIVQAFPDGITLPSPEYYKDKDTLASYQKLLEEVFSTLLPHETWKKSASVLAKAVVELEVKIAEITPPPEDLQDVTKYYNIEKIDKVGELGPALRLDKTVRALAPKDYKDSSMLLAFPEFLTKTSNLIADTPKRVLQSYFIWKVIYSYASAIEAPEVKPISRFNNVLSGRDPETKTERWKTCLRHVDGTIGWILSRFYIEAAFSEEAKKFGDEIITDIKHQFISKLNGLSWMDESVKELAVNKVKNIDQKIGYPTKPPNIMEPPALRDYYKDLPISDSFFKNTLSSAKWSSDKSWSSLGKPVDHNEWGMQADIINAYYNPVGNEIVFPAGIMQFPVFDVDLPSYLSYGAFASVAGHELSHAFDSSGRHYDEHGNFTDWWTGRTVKEFTKRADCFVAQHGNFTVEGTDGKPLHVNGKLTLGENIADAGGVAAAFAAWKQRQDTQPDKNLPGLEFFSQDQLFFIFYANFWCGKIRKEQAINYIYTDPHSPAWARILGTTANSREFRESFNCPVKEPTCELW